MVYNDLPLQHLQEEEYIHFHLTEGKDLGDCFQKCLLIVDVSCMSLSNARYLRLDFFQMPELISIPDQSCEMTDIQMRITCGGV